MTLEFIAPWSTKVEPFRWTLRFIELFSSAVKSYYHIDIDCQ